MLILARGNSVVAILVLTLRTDSQIKLSAERKKGVKDKAAAGDSGCQPGVGHQGGQTFLSEWCGTEVRDS